VVHRPGNVEYDDALEVGQRNSPSVTPQSDYWFTVTSY